MRFFCLLPVRDEADIIGQCLRHLLAWADAIYVFDTGSVDETWEIVQEWAARDKRVIPLRKDPVYYSEGNLRGWIFHQARQQMRNGDWFLRVDADEFHHVPPPEFVKMRLRRHETIVWHQYYDFRLTESEVRAWDEGRETPSDRKRPIEERRRWHTCSVYSEPRLCKYRDTMRWPATISFPFNSGFVARERLPIRHYPHRDPAQLDRRCRLRAAMMRDPAIDAGSFAHWRTGEWRQFIAPDKFPELRYWQPGTDFSEVHWENHLAAPHKRAAQRLAHAVGLPVLDRLRSGWVEGTYPGKIPGDVVQHLTQELAREPGQTSSVCR
jgi:hypothetical protein